MSSIFIIVQTRESDKGAVDLLNHLIEKKDVKALDTKSLDPNTVIISLQDIQADSLEKILSDSKQWSEDSGFLFLTNEGGVHTSISSGGTVEKEDTTILSLLEL